jgi:Zn finger protein HypA/HybF involved in hydrogenase expression
MRYTREVLAPVIAESNSFAEVCTKLGVLNDGSTPGAIKNWAKRYGLSTVHFRGKAWSRGKTAETDSRVAQVTAKLTLPDELVFAKGTNPKAAKRRYYERTPHVCEHCGQGPIWNGKPLRHHIDHRNGDSSDNRWENLCKLCPNCHSQTETYAGRNIRLKNVSVAELADALAMKAGDTRKGRWISQWMHDGVVVTNSGRNSCRFESCSRHQVWRVGRVADASCLLNRPSGERRMRGFFTSGPASDHGEYNFAF